MEKEIAYINLTDASTANPGRKKVATYYFFFQNISTSRLLLNWFVKKLLSSAYSPR